MVLRLSSSQLLSADGVHIWLTGLHEATKATKAQNFPNSLYIYYYKISFYKNTVLSLSGADFWLNQAISSGTKPAQN